MLLKDEERTKRLFPRMSRTMLGIGVLCILAFFGLTYFSPYIGMADGDVVFCDAEHARNGKFINNGIEFSYGKYQSSEEAHSGNYSCRLDSTSNYGFGYEIKNPEPGDRYRVSVWRKKVGQTPANLVVSAPDSKSYYQYAKLATEKGPDGWEQLVINVQIPYLKKVDRLNVYVYKPHGELAYFDDLRIAKLADTTTSNGFVIEKLELQIQEKGMEKLRKKRTEALRKGILSSADDDWVGAKILKGEHKTNAKLRLKGDWMDHLKSEKWSFRVSVKEPESWKRLQTFSIQNPKTRHYLNEWFYHQLLESQDVLTTRFDYIELEINGQALGTYLYEEHFLKQLLEYKKRREGPIVRFTEDEYWNGYQRQFDMLGNLYFVDHKKDAMRASPIQPFGTNKTANSPTLSKQFEIAQDLMHQYRHNQKKPSVIFDIDQMAKFYAITDVAAAFHGLTWHNQRFYYNPVVGKLEPIGFDGFADELTPWSPGDGFFIAQGVFNKGFLGVEAYKKLFYDREFIALYHQYLNQFSSDNFLESFFMSLEPGLTQREAFLQREFKDYKFNKKDLLVRSKKIQAMLYPYHNTGIQAWTQAKTSNSKALKISNFHFTALEILGSGKNRKTMSNKLESPILIIPRKRNEIAKFADLSVGLEDQYLFYGLPGIDSVFQTQISTFRTALPTTPQQELWENVVLQSNEVYTLEGKRVLFKKGKITTNKDILIPDGYQVEFEEGVELNLTNKAKFISKSPIKMKGTEDTPIRIYSSDKTANGFTIIQSPIKSTLQYVLFEDLNTLNHKGWLLTGAVTFYESDVALNHCTFTKNHCEDALNIVRSNFDMTHCTVSQTFGDGFDADYCVGSINYSRFYKTGNDAIDFSTSTITIANCNIEDIGDKGISVGEQATVTVSNTTIDGAVIGVASKDLSELTIQSIHLKNCRQGFTAYQKKPEYGGASIEVVKYQAENINQLHLIEAGSRLKLPGDKIIGEQKQVKNQRPDGLEDIIR